MDHLFLTLANYRHQKFR